MSTIYKIDVRLYIGPEPAPDGKCRSGSLQPEYVTHTYSFKKDPGEQEPEYVCLMCYLDTVLTSLVDILKITVRLSGPKRRGRPILPKLKKKQVRGTRNFERSLLEGKHLVPLRDPSDSFNRKFAGPSYWVKRGKGYRPVKSVDPKLVNSKGEEAQKPWKCPTQVDSWEKIQNEPLVAEEE